MTEHNFEAVIIHDIARPVPNEDWIERRRENVFSMRFTARGDGTAAKIVSEFCSSIPERRYNHTWRIFRVMDGVRMAKDIREQAAERARRFSPGVRW